MELLGIRSIAAGFLFAANFQRFVPGFGVIQLSLHFAELVFGGGSGKLGFHLLVTVVLQLLLHSVCFI